MKKEDIKILIVEDEDALGEILKTKIAKEGYQASLAKDGAAGYEKMKSWQPNLVLLDIVMEKMNGYEVMEKMNEENIKIPVIIISNSGQPVEIEKTKKLGAVGHLIKTEFEPNEVIQKINDFLEGKKPQKAVVNNKSANSKSAKVMLVEDEILLREICAKKLIAEGYVVEQAVDGEQALSKIAEFKPDLILLDIILPAIDGFDVLSKIRSNPDSKIAKIPVIMLSNLGQQGDIDRALELGANGYLIKAHFTTEEIANKVKETINK